MPKTPAIHRLDDARCGCVADTGVSFFPGHQTARVGSRALGRVREQWHLPCSVLGMTPRKIATLCSFVAIATATAIVFAAGSASAQTTSSRGHSIASSTRVFPLAAQNNRPTLVIVNNNRATDPVRLRFGLAVDGNILAAPSTVGLAVGVTARIGLQFHHWLAMYYQPHFFLGGWLSNNASGVIAGLYNTFAAELTVSFVQFAVGPSVDILGVSGCNDRNRNVGCISGDAAFFGADARIALLLGNRSPGGGALSINFNIHPTFVGGGPVWLFGAGIGGELH